MKTIRISRSPTGPSVNAAYTGDSKPKCIIGRFADSFELDNRGDVKHDVTAQAEYTSGAVGTASATLYQSTDDEDRGGVVLRLEIEDSGSSFEPFALLTSKGVEIHLAGEAEAQAMLNALQEALRHRVHKERDDYVDVTSTRRSLEVS